MQPADARFDPRHARDKRAIAALDQAWEAWLDDQADHGVDPAEVDYAQSAGYWQDDALLPHDEIITRCLAARDALDVRQLAKGFIHGLAQNRPDWWSALASFGYVQHLRAHVGAEGELSRSCGICGLSLWPTDEGFEPIAWQMNPQLSGIIETGSRPSISSATASLLFAASFPPFPEPNQDDLAPLRGLLAQLEDLPAKTTAPKLAKLLKPIFGKNNDQRLNLVEALSILGILTPEGNATYFERFVSFDETQVGSPRNDTEFPARAWQSEHGVNEAALRHWFGEWLD